MLSADDVAATNRTGSSSLNADDAVEIYFYMLRLCRSMSCAECLIGAKRFLKGKTSRLAVKYGVGTRTILNIWRRKSWGSATKRLWLVRPETLIEIEPEHPSLEDAVIRDGPDPFHDDWKWPSYMDVM